MNIYSFKQLNSCYVLSTHTIILSKFILLFLTSNCLYEYTIITLLSLLICFSNKHNFCCFFLCTLKPHQHTSFSYFYASPICVLAVNNQMSSSILVIGEKNSCKSFWVIICLDGFLQLCIFNCT